MLGCARTWNYAYLACFWKKGFRNGNWRKLQHVERALYMASLSLARMRGRLMNANLIGQLGCIIEKIRETAGLRLIDGAHRRAADLYGRFEAIGLFGWAPMVRSWFDDPGYILWVGISPTCHIGV